MHDGTLSGGMGHRHYIGKHSEHFTTIISLLLVVVDVDVFLCFVFYYIFQYRVNSRSLVKDPDFFDR